jgi:hypothetical protein
MTKINIRGVLLTVLPTRSPHIEADFILPVKNYAPGHKSLIHPVKHVLDGIVS